MNILVDVTFIVRGRNRGAETYVNALLSELCKVPDANVVCLTNRLNHDYYQNELGLECRASASQGGNRAARFLYQQIGLGAVAKATCADVLFCPGNLSPVRPTVPTVSVIHDVNFYDIPKSMPRGVRLVFRAGMPWMVRSAARVVTVSEYSKRRIVETLGIAGDKVVVIHEGAPADVGRAGEGDWRAVKRKYGIRGDFFLSVSSGLPHKNIERLVCGFGEMKKRSTGGHQLVLVGHELDRATESRLEGESFRDDVVVTGYVSEAEKFSLFRNGLAYVYPSLYEGFGLPALEAQSCGLPLAASRCGSLPEVCGSGAVYFDALSVDSIANTMLDIAGDAVLRTDLVRRGYDNAARFSWRRAAAETYALLKSVVESGGAGPARTRPAGRVGVTA